MEESLIVWIWESHNCLLVYKITLLVHLSIFYLQDHSKSIHIKQAISHLEKM